ncbi:glycoside hydrolase family 70 protein [Leuconostoc fallax]|nr:glycoside hydrolase family 70 protein [Leuconostoc fallax]
MKQQESITRKKLYKAGKSWVVAATLFAATLFAAMGAAGATTVASADVQKDTVVVTADKNTTDKDKEPIKTAGANVVDKGVAQTTDTNTTDKKTIEVGKSVDMSATDKKVTETVKSVDTSATDKKTTEAVKPVDTNATDKKATEAVKPVDTNATDKKTTEAVKPVDTNTTDKKVTEAIKPVNTNADDKTAEPVKTISATKDTVKTIANKQKGATEEQAVITEGHYEAQGDGFVYITKDGKQLTGLQNINGNTQYFDPATGQQLKGDIKAVAGTVYYFDKNSGNARVYQKVADGTYSENNEHWQYISKVDNKPVEGLYNVQGNLQYFDMSTGNQVKNDIRSVDGVTYYFDKDSGNGSAFNALSAGEYVEKKETDAQGNQNSYWTYSGLDGNPVKGLYDINGSLQYFDEKNGAQLKGGTATVNGVTYYFEQDKGNLISVVNSVESGQYKIDNDNVYYIDNQGNTLKGLYAINGQLNYFDMSTGVQLKGASENANGVGYYFDKDKGNGQYQYSLITSTLANAFSKHNAANDYTQSSFTHTVDGFLTADTWYRPTEILKNGTTWVASTSQDLRPMITVWWPNKNVQLNYLKLMQTEGLLDSGQVYDLNSDQALLNQAAQTVQVNIEKRITKAGNSDWLNDLLYNSHGETPSFVKQQAIWNADSEYHGGWFQGGYLAYRNSDLTPYANSSYRHYTGMEFLLANDVDNSNPIVQAEDLNWLYYLMNFGTETGNDPQANFDSIRIDAISFVDKQVAKKAYELLHDMYGLSASDAVANKHVSIVEASADQTPVTTENHDALIESYWRDTMKNSLSKDASIDSSAGSLSAMINDGNVDRANDSTTESSIFPNYTIVHAHDKDIQDAVSNVMKIVNNDPSISLDGFTMEQLEKGLSAFYADQRSAVKQYNQYNIPSAYAVMLTNKDTVPRTFYGDMYQDDGQYMANKSLYYDAIDTMMKARLKYVSGGQTMSVTKINNANSQKSGEVLTSVRFGKGVMDATDAGSAESRTQGIGVVVSNSSGLQLNDNDKIVLHMGAAHKNQEYRALMLTTNDGIKSFNNDEAPINYTDDNGDLIFDGHNIDGQENTAIRGYLNPQVAGYLAVWVPTGAKDDQDARTQPSNEKSTDGKVLHTNAALDSELIYEGFSNFQPMPTTKDEYTNVMIAKNIDLFKSWGITNFELAPQYRSSDGKNINDRFIDSLVQNGYGLSDRYDLGFETPTKYGTDQDLRTAIKTLHQAGMTVMADYVANQIYGLNTSQEVVDAQRVNSDNNAVEVRYGQHLNVVNSIGGGEYQNLYGGKYLEILNKLYPDLLVDENGNKIDIDTKIKQWSAKYLNGSNVTGLGMGYVLKDWSNGQYFNISNTDGKVMLPEQLVKHMPAVEIGTQTNYTAYISSTIRRDGLYNNMPWGVTATGQDGNEIKWERQGSTSDYNHQKVQVNRQYVDKQGVVWNLINFDDKDLWVDSNALVTVNFTSQKPTKHFVQFGMRQGKYDGFYLSAPYKQTESKWVASTRTHQGQLLEVVGQYTTGSGSRKVTWYLVGLDGKQVWVDSRAVGTNFSHKTNINLLINSATRNDGMYLNAPYGQKGYKRETSSRFYNEKLVTVSQQYYDNKGVIWNLITLNGKKLWVDSRAFATVIDKKVNQSLYINSRNDGMYLNAPYRAQGAKRYASTKTYTGQRVQVTLQRKDTHGVTWYLTKVDSKQLWVDSHAFAPTFTRNVSLNVKVNSSKRNDGIYLNAPYGNKKAKRIASTKAYNGKRVKASKEYKDAKGVTWYLVNLNNKQVWIDKRAF